MRRGCRHRHPSRKVMGRGCGSWDETRPPCGQPAYDRLRGESTAPVGRRGPLTRWHRGGGASAPPLDPQKGSPRILRRPGRACNQRPPRLPDYDVLVQQQGCHCREVATRWRDSTTKRSPSADSSPIRGYDRAAPLTSPHRRPREPANTRGGTSTLSRGATTTVPRFPGYQACSFEVVASGQALGRLSDVDWRRVGARVLHGGESGPKGPTSSCTRPRRNWEASGGLVSNRTEGRGSRGRAAQPRRPTRTAAQIRSPSCAPAVTASPQCCNHSPTPCRPPLTYAVSAPR